MSPAFGPAQQQKGPLRCQRGPRIDLDRLDRDVDARAVEALGNRTARPRHRLIDGVNVLRTSRIVDLLVFTFHDVQLHGIIINDVRIVGTGGFASGITRHGDGVKGRVIHELTNTLEGNGADLDVEALGEAGLGVEALRVDLRFKLLEEARTADNRARLTAEAGQLADFRTKTVDNVGLASCVSKLSSAVTPSRLESTVNTAGETGSIEIRAASDCSIRTNVLRDTRKDISALRAVQPEHFVEATSPTFRHVIHLSLQNVGQDRDIAVGVLRGRFASGRIGDGDTVMLQFREGHGKASMQLCPRKLDALRVGRILVADSLVVGVAHDGGRVVKHDREVDMTLTTRESLLALREKVEQGLVLDGLGHSVALDVEVESGIGDVFKFAD